VENKLEQLLERPSRPFTPRAGPAWPARILQAGVIYHVKEEPVYLGVDIAKSSLDVAVGNDKRRFAHDRVGHACGISHNAPYKHFRNRDTLLAAVATADFILLADAFRKARSSAEKPTAKLTRTLKVLVDFSKKHPARYHLLFRTPSIAAQHGELKKAAVGAFAEVVGIVGECQSLGELPEAPSATIALLLFATAHGLIAIEANGGLHPEKGLAGGAPASNCWCSSCL
jgi:AcrR family transcriptional regulator